MLEWCTFDAVSPLDLPVLTPENDILGPNIKGYITDKLKICTAYTCYDIAEWLPLFQNRHNTTLPPIPPPPKDVPTHPALCYFPK